MSDLDRLTGKRLALRNHHAADLGPLCDMWCDPDQTYYLGFDTMTESRVMEALDDAQREARERPRRRYRLAAVHVCDGSFAGTLGVELEDARTAQLLAVSMHPSTRGQGLGREATELVTGFAFECLGVQRVWGYLSPLNVRSHRMFVSLGFRTECVLPGLHTKFGQQWDVERFAVSRQDWRARPRAYALADSGPRTNATVPDHPRVTRQP